MRARQPPRTTGSKGRAIAFAAWLAGGLLGCGGSTPMDMWLTKDPDAGAGYVAPMREAGAESDASGGTGGAGGQGGDTGAAGTNGAGGDTGSAGASGGQGGDGQGGDTGGASAGGTGGSN